MISNGRTHWYTGDYHYPECGHAAQPVYTDGHSLYVYCPECKFTRTLGLLGVEYSDRIKSKPPE